MKKQCPKCGGLNDPESKKCQYCGSIFSLFKSSQSPSGDWGKNKVKGSIVASEDLVFEITEQALNQIMLSAVQSFPFESLGILFGFRSDNKIACEISKSLKYTIYTEESVGKRNRTITEMISLDNISKEFTGTNYVGEYHSHPYPVSKFISFLKYNESKNLGFNKEQILDLSLKQMTGHSDLDLKSMSNYPGLISLVISMIDVGDYHGIEASNWRIYDSHFLYSNSVVPVNTQKLEDILIEIDEDFIKDLINNIKHPDFKKDVIDYINKEKKTHNNKYIGYGYLSTILTREDYIPLYKDEEKTEELYHRLIEISNKVIHRYVEKRSSLKKKNIVFLITALTYDSVDDVYYQPEIRIGKTLNIVTCPRCGAQMEHGLKTCSYCGR